MFAPFNMTNSWSGRSRRHDNDRTKSWQDLWNRFKVWLMEPIEFPGKLPEKCARQKEYNSRERTDTTTPHN